MIRTTTFDQLYEWKTRKKYTEKYKKFVRLDKTAVIILFWTSSSYLGLVRGCLISAIQTCIYHLHRPQLDHSLAQLPPL